MRAFWDAPGTRAVGMGTHLASRAELEAMSAAESVEALSIQLERFGIVAAESRAGLAERLDIGVRRAAGLALERLAIWCGPRRDALAVFLLDEERRAVRGLIRGLVGAEPPETRISGLVPTPRLSERALRRLGEAADLVTLRTQLEAIGSPYARALAGVDEVKPVDLLEIEVALGRIWAESALRQLPRRAPELSLFVRDAIDLENLWTLLLTRGRDRVSRPLDSLWIEGGRSVKPEQLRAIVTTEDEREAIGLLRGPGLPDSWRQFSTAIDVDVSEWESAALRMRISDLARKRRLSPLGVIPILWYLTRLRGQIVDLSRMVWGIALGVPGTILRSRLVSP